MNAAQLGLIKNAELQIRQGAATLRRVAGSLPDSGSESAWKYEIQEWIKSADALLNAKPGGLAVALPRMKITTTIKPKARQGIPAAVGKEG